MIWVLFSASLVSLTHIHTLIYAQTHTHVHQTHALFVLTAFSLVVNLSKRETEIFPKSSCLYVSSDPHLPNQVVYNRSTNSLFSELFSQGNPKGEHLSTEQVGRLGDDQGVQVGESGSERRARRHQTVCHRLTLGIHQSPGLPGNAGYFLGALFGADMLGDEGNWITYLFYLSFWIALRWWLAALLTCPCML